MTVEAKRKETSAIGKKIETVPLTENALSLKIYF